VTKHSDYFIWKDTLARMTWRCDDTSWQDASEFLRIKTSLFLWEISNQKNRQKTPETWMLSPMRYQYHVLNISWLAPQKKLFLETALCAVFINSLVNGLIRGHRFWEVVCFTGEKNFTGTKLVLYSLFSRSWDAKWLSEWKSDPGIIWSGDFFYYCSERNNVVGFFGTLKVQSLILTEVSACGLLIVVTSSTFLKRKTC